MKPLKRQPWKLSKLRPHPRQDAMFDDLPEVELEALAEDIRVNGLRHPVEILPDGIIIAGHQRCRAARHLGWSSIDVVVRSDLAEQGDDAVEAYFVKDNFMRRQLTPLGRARCVKRLMDVEGQIPTWNHYGRREALKAEIGRRLRMSARNVARYLLVLDAPPVVQQAFDAGQLTLITAGKVAMLAKHKQRDLAKRIENGEPVAQVVKEVLSSSPVDTNTPDRSFNRLMVALRHEVAHLDSRVDEINSRRLAGSAETLHHARDLLRKLIARAKHVSDTVTEVPSLEAIMSSLPPRGARSN